VELVAERQPFAEFEADAALRVGRLETEHVPLDSTPFGRAAADHAADAVFRHELEGALGAALDADPRLREQPRAFWGRTSRLASPLPLAQVAFAVEARDHLQGAVYGPKEQSVRETPASGTADISVDHWKLLGRRGDPRNDVLDLRNEAIRQLRITSGIPIACFDQLSPRSGAEDTDGTLSAAVEARR